MYDRGNYIRFVSLLNLVHVRREKNFEKAVPPSQATILLSTLIGGTSLISSIGDFLLVSYYNSRNKLKFHIFLSTIL